MKIFLDSTFDNALTTTMKHHLQIVTVFEATCNEQNDFVDACNGDCKFNGILRTFNSHLQQYSQPEVPDSYYEKSITSWNVVIETYSLSTIISSWNSSAKHSLLKPCYVFLMVPCRVTVLVVYYLHLLVYYLVIWYLFKTVLSCDADSSHFNSWNLINTL